MLRSLLALCGPVVAFCALGRNFRTTQLSEGLSPTLSVSVKNIVQGAHVVVHATNGSHSDSDVHVGYANAVKHVNSGAHVAVSSQAMNRSRLKVDLASEKIQRAIEEFIDGSMDPKNLEEQLEKKAEEEGVDQVITELGDQLPKEVASLLKVERSNQPLDEGSIAKARGILNGMIEKSQVALDKKVIECKEFKGKNRGAEKITVGDLSRLGSMLANLAKQDSESKSGIAEADSEMTKLQEMRDAELKKFGELKKADEATMADRKKDLDVATFVLKFTMCKPGQLLLQKPAVPVAENNLCALPNSAEDMHFEDAEMEKEALKLTPEARAQVWQYLGNGPSNKTANLQVHGEGDEVVDNNDDDDVEYDNDEDLTPDDLGDMDDLTKNVKEDHTMALVKQAPPVAYVALKQPGKGMSKKCTLGKPQCGLLHDNMSLMWGKMKDAVDLLQMKMDKDAAAHHALMEDMNTQTANLGNQKSTMQTQMSEATSQRASIGEEQKGKQGEQRILNKEYKQVWGECKQAIYEILFTNICGVKQVRGELSKKSKAVPPGAITDCEVSDWVPKECSKTCDDSCAKTEPGGPPCGGEQELVREIVAKPNENGAKCPILSLNKTCGQLPCPVDCKMGAWSEWNLCTKECGGGIQGRTRPINEKPLNNGAACEPAQEMRGCNTGSCERECTLKPWTPYSPCSQMCDGGEQEKHRKIAIKARAGGECPKPKSPKRFHSQKCNVQPCIGDEQCIAKIDLIIAVDGSGSISEKGFATLRDFVAALVGRFEGRAYGVDAMQVGVVLFGNGKVMPDGSISDGTIVSPLSSDMKGVQAAVGGMAWKKGFTNLAQAFTTAQRVLNEKGRKHATSAIMVLTDGKPSFKVQTWQAVKKVKSHGVVVNVVSVQTFPTKPDRRFMKKIATAPAKSNFVAIPGLTKLKRQMDKYVTRVLAQTCPKAESPKQVLENQKLKGWKFIREGAWCGEKPAKGKDPNRVALSEEPVLDANICGDLAIKAEAKFFSFGTEKGFNFGQCYKEVTAEGDEGCAKTGWAKTSVNTYEVLPPMKIG